MGNTIKQERIMFDKETRLKVLQKSKYKCAKCGKSLYIHAKNKFTKDCTIDHVIPLEVGGTNDIENLIGLCRTCNRDKGELVVDASNYYPFLISKYKKEVELLFKKFEETSDYLSPNRLFFKDEFVFEIKMLVGSGKKLVTASKPVIRRANYSDLDAVYEFMKYYISKYPMPIKDLWKTISVWFDYGCIYYTSDSRGIKMVIFPHIYLFKEGESKYLEDLFIPSIVNYVFLHPDIELVSNNKVNYTIGYNLNGDCEYHTLVGAKYIDIMKEFKYSLLDSLNIPAGAFLYVAFPNADDRFSVYRDEDTEDTTYCMTRPDIYFSDSTKDIIANSSVDVNELTIREFIYHPGIRFALQEYRDLINNLYSDEDQELLLYVLNGESYADVYDLSGSSMSKFYD